MAISNKDKPVVVIIGAGLTGLLAAQGLKQNGFRAIVVEKEEGIDARPREWTMLVHWAMPIFQRLVPENILQNLDDALCNPHLEFDAQVETLPCYNGVTGKLLFCSPTPGARRVSRRRLRALLARDVDIRWGMSLKRISRLENGIKADFENGTSIDADYLLGADGTSSRVREMLVGAEAAQPQGSGFLFATGINRFEEAEKTGVIVNKHPVAALMMGTGSVGGIGAPLRDEFQLAIDWTRQDSYVSVNEMKYWVPVAWDNLDGRATLAGDAAHPMLIYRGQGFQHSITDVDNYVQALERLHANVGAGNKASRVDVMGAYDDEVVQRGATAVEQSLCEAEKSLDIKTVKQMLMATKGHGK
ncbi:hypothetical protein ARSEF4850_004685 [Beauveria asiatica]